MTHHPRPSAELIAALAARHIRVRSHLKVHGWGVLGIGQKIAILAALAPGAASLALSMVRQMVPGSKCIITPAAPPAGILVSLLLVLAAVFRPQQGSDIVSNGLMCMKIGLTYSMTTAFLVWMLLRRGAVLYPKLIGAAGGGCTGLGGP